MSSTTTTTAAAAATTTSQSSIGKGQDDQGIGIVSFLSAVGIAVAIFAAQTLLFLLLRNKLARIFKPKTYLVPERERTDPPPAGFFGMMKHLMKLPDREVIKKCGLDAFFFLRYLRTLLVIFIPICAVVLPILIPINYVGGKGQNIDIGSDDASRTNSSQVVGLDTLAWGNVRASHTKRYSAHLLLALLVVIWVCVVFFFELRVYIKVRQDYLTSAEHRLRASATTVLVNSIPKKWLSEEALRGLFDVFPGGIRNIWLNRDLTELLDKIEKRDKIHKKLESAETTLIRDAKKAQLKAREAEEKKERRKLKLGSLTKKERAQREAREDAEAKRRAGGDEGLEAGDNHETPHGVAAGVEESQNEAQAGHKKHGQKSSGGFKIPILGDPLSKVGRGVKGVVHKAGDEVEGQIETTNGFVGLDSSGRNEPSQSLDADPLRSHSMDMARSPASDTLRLQTTHSRPTSADSERAINKDEIPVAGLNTVRKADNLEDMYNNEEVKFWEFWKQPKGGYASPVPQGEAADYMTARTDKNKSFWQTVKGFIPFMGGEELESLEYPLAYNPDYKEEEHGDAEWAKYLKKKDRPTHHLSLFGVMALPGIPLITKKVDTIYWCREELARLNLEIEEDQKHPERYPLMTSAFIQFEHQVAAHMACQSTIHHIPRTMSPRMLEVAPKDVVWSNMAVSWWSEWLRTGIIVISVLAMIILWAIPVAWTAALGQLDELIHDQPWLGFLKENQNVENLAKAVAGVLPAAVLGLLLFLVPVILEILAGIKGAKTGAQKTEFVQVYYFFFLFVQVFLIVSIASFFAASLDTLVDNLSKLQSPKYVLELLADNLPKAGNYFFQYMILQAMSVSSGTLLQIGSLFTWYILARILDSTARNKWRRNTNLSDVTWGKFFPVYTNFACIGLVYCVVAPLISIFAIITFSLLWVAHRYSMLYVIRFESDTGGVLYPRAINQTFTGVYVMELCIAGLFFIVQDTKGNHVCTTHGIIMLVALGLTILYQVLLNYSFSPLFRYLPITIEDEAVLRDQAFQRAQDRRLGLINEDEDELTGLHNGGMSPGGERGEKSPGLQRDEGAIELSRLDRAQNMMRMPVKQVGTWAKDGGNQLRKLKVITGDQQASEYRQRQRQKDLEAQRAIGEALYGGFHDEIEDLTPEERDWLTRHAFKHIALRARRPTVWIPRDDLGISDDEIRRTRAYSDNIWISNEGTALDSKVRVIYGKNPPDFSDVDLINL